MKYIDLYCSSCGKYVATVMHMWYNKGYTRLSNKEYGAIEYKKNGGHYWLCHDCQRQAQVNLPEQWFPACHDSLTLPGKRDCHGMHEPNMDCLLSNCLKCPFIVIDGDKNE